MTMLLDRAITLESESQREMVVKVVEDLADFEALKGEWNELLEASASNCLFLTWEWLYTWWKHFAKGRRLFIITVRCGGELVAIAPLAVRPRKLSHPLPFRLVEFLGMGTVGSDYLDFIIRRGREEEALQALGEYLTRGKLMLQLAQVKRGSCFAANLAAQLMQRGWRLSEAQINICPFINLSGHSLESYFATLGSKNRGDLQRRLRNLTQQFDARFEQALSEEKRREALALLVTLHNMRWRDRGGSAAFHTAGFLSFYEELSRLALERGWLRLFVLWLDGKPAAARCGFMYHRTLYSYQSGFDPLYAKHGLGLIAVLLAIESAIAEGAEEYDFLAGTEEYKFRLAREARELGRIELYPPGPRGLLYEGTVRLSRATRRMGRRLLPKTRADRIATGRGLAMWQGHYAAAPR